jgi:hypothetical protein
MIYDQPTTVRLIGKKCGKTAHEVSNVNQGWVSIPVVVIFGDFYQLPSVACSGATAVLSQVGEYKSLSNNTKE